MTTTVTEIDFACWDKEAGEKISTYLSGKTYLKLRAHTMSYPCAGNDRVYVSTSDPHVTEDEVRAMVMSLLADMATGHS